MRSANAARDEWPQLPFAVPQHVEKAKRILVEVGVERFGISLRSGVPLAKTGIVSAPHEFGLRVIGERVIDEGAVAPPAVHAEAIDRKGIGDWIGSAGFVAYKRRHRSEERRVGKECRSRWWT